MIDYNKFDSDIAVEDSELAFVLLDSRLDDEEHNLLLEIYRNVHAPEDKAPRGKKIVYSVVLSNTDEIEAHCDFKSVEKAVDCYIKAVQTNHDLCDVRLCRFETEDEDELYDLFSMQSYELLAAKYA